MLEGDITKLPLIAGREREFATLWSHFEALQPGRPRVILLGGEPGIGKTRLLDAVAVRATQQGAIVLRGGASEAAGMPPYLPFLEALGHYIRTASTSHLRQQTGEMAAILATILPELNLRLGELPASYPLPPEQARFRLYTAVETFLAAIATPPGLLLLILDDLQWADQASLDLLCYIARSQYQVRLLILGAFREGEVEPNIAFQRTLAELNRLRSLSRVMIGPLSEAAIATLAANYLDAPVERATGHRVYTQSEGNPFFAEELLNDWLETGALVLDQADQSWSLITPGGATLPSSIVNAVGQRLTRLAPEVIEVLRSAAIIGRTFDLALLAQVTAQELEPVEVYLRQAVQARLIRPGEPGTFTFSHDKIRECLYQQVPTVRRWRLHSLIGQGLEALLGSKPASARHLADLAFHFARSGDRNRGVGYTQKAAAQAMQAYAPEEALAHYRIALGLTDQGDPRRGEVLFGLGEAAALAGGVEEAVAAFQRAQEWFEAAGEEVAAARAAHALGKVWWQREAIAEAKAAFEIAVRLLEDRVQPEGVRVLVDLSSLLALSLHQLEAGLTYARQALELAEQLKDDRLIAAATRTVGNLLARSSDPPGGIELLEKALDLADVSTDPAEAAECCACLTMLFFWKGELGQTLEYGQRQIGYAQLCHNSYLQRHVFSLLAQVYFYLGKLDQANQMLDAAQLVLESLAAPEALAFLALNRGGIASCKGDYGRAEQLCAQAMATLRSLNPQNAVWYQGGFALIQARAGKTEEARAGLDELERVVPELAVGSMVSAYIIASLVQAALELDERERPIRFYPQLAIFRGGFMDVLVDRLLGIIETLQGDFAAAHASLAAAETCARREGIRWELAYVLLAQAELEQAHPGPTSTERVSHLLGEAQAIFDSLGNQAEVQRLQKQLDHLITKPPTRPRLSYPAGLSQREVEVLRLVVAGNSNREIARLLVISERTVINHLASIFTKTGADNRTAAATFAIREGLADS